MTSASELKETRTDLTIPSRDVNRLPMISAEAYQLVGRFAGAIVMSCFEQIGGLPRMAAWADSNPTDYYTKLFPKLISRSQQVDVSGTLTLDDAITRLENQATGNSPVDADFDEIAGQYDL